MDCVVRQAPLAISLGNLAREHRACGTVDALDPRFDLYRCAFFKRCTRLFDQCAVEYRIKMMILPLRMMDIARLAGIWLQEKLREIEPLGLPVIKRVVAIQHLHLANHVAESPIAKPRHFLTHFFSHKEEEIDHMLRQANKALAQNRVLRRNTHGAGIQMTLPHHDAPRSN